MHEILFAREIIAIIEKKVNPNKKNRLVSVNVCLSPLSHVRPETLRETFYQTTKGTSFEKISLNIKPAPLKLKCNYCRKTFTLEKPLFTCPVCQGENLEAQVTKECYVESIEIA